MTVDKILSGGKIIIKSNKYIEIGRIKEELEYIKRLDLYFGKDSNIYKGAYQGINQLMNLDLADIFENQYHEEVLLTEVIIGYLMDGYKIDKEALLEHIKSEKMLKIIYKYQ